jgi:hypothetical protein
MLKYLTKITMDILPSVVATIIGAYIVNHYIAAKPPADAPVAAAVSTAQPKKVEAASVDVGSNIPAAGVRAKGISEKAIFEKATAEKPQEKSLGKPPEKPQAKPVEKSVVAEKSPEKSPEKSLDPAEDRLGETASISADVRRHPAAPREKEKTAVRVISLSAAAQPAVQPAASVATPTAPAPTVEAAIAPEEHRDANDLARAAIERLRGSSESAPRAQETARVPDAAPRVASVPQAPVPQAPAVRPLPPPIMVSTPPTDNLGSPTQPYSAQPYPATAQVDDPRRPIPPADIPPPAPVNLDGSARPHTNVAEDMLLAAKSVFHSVLPQ